MHIMSYAPNKIASSNKDMALQHIHRIFIRISSRDPKGSVKEVATFLKKTLLKKI